MKFVLYFSLCTYSIDRRNGSSWARVCMYVYVYKIKNGYDEIELSSKKTPEYA